jgi:hypothetical protein
VSAPLRVSFVFASRGIGGAERSMVRLMAQAGTICGVGLGVARAATRAA